MRAPMMVEYVLQSRGGHTTQRAITQGAITKEAITQGELAQPPHNLGLHRETTGFLDDGSVRDWYCMFD